mmetsp:Transcript_42912/g.96988  ORF Transcript_42912/g.96988 Transcript_42912/m.96988 type:complete len:236 (+) Transcript_42912:302-1009(+)
MAILQPPFLFAYLAVNGSIYLNSSRASCLHLWGSKLQSGQGEYNRYLRHTRPPGPCSALLVCREDRKLAHCRCLCLWAARREGRNLRCSSRVASPPRSDSNHRSVAGLRSQGKLSTRHHCRRPETTGASCSTRANMCGFQNPRDQALSWQVGRRDLRPRERCRRRRIGKSASAPPTLWRPRVGSVSTSNQYLCLIRQGTARYGCCSCMQQYFHPGLTRGWSHIWRAGVSGYHARR